MVGFIWFCFNKQTHSMDPKLIVAKSNHQISLPLFLAAVSIQGGVFHKWGYPQIIIQTGASHRNHPAMGVPPLMETSMVKSAATASLAAASPSSWDFRSVVPCLVAPWQTWRTQRRELKDEQDLRERHLYGIINERVCRCLVLMSFNIHQSRSSMLLNRPHC